MASPVTLENDDLRLEVWPALGGKISSLVDKADEYELLFNYPAELPERPLYDVNYVKGWYAGWDECFPAVAPSRYAGHPYDAVPVPDHGELWGIPTVAAPTKDGITVVWHGLRFAYRLTRKLSLDGPSVRAHYTLENLAPFDLRFVWAMHALLATDAAHPVRLSLPGHRAFRLSHDGRGDEIQQSFEWSSPPPQLEGIDRPGELPAGQAWKVYSDEPITRPIVIDYPRRPQSRRLSIEFATDADLRAYWGLWLNTGGWAGHSHLGVLPTTGRYDQLDRSIRDGSAGCVAAGGRSDWAVTWRVGPGLASTSTPDSSSD
jgi:hypothetical protein